MEIRPCIVIPHFDHDGLLAGTLDEVLGYRLPVLVVDDGSPAASVARLSRLAQSRDGVSVIYRADNGGKGAAVISGLREAWIRGFTHAVQVDADGQHDLSPLGRMLAAAAEYPGDLIATRPVYDSSAPFSRVAGRKLTNFMVAIETLGRSLPDVMCGFRVYPLASTVPLLGTVGMGRRMDFDIEVMVRAQWQGIRVRYLPVSVRYPEQGISHFRMVKDNVLISLKHTMLVIGMLLRLPMLLRNGRVLGRTLEIEE